MSYNSYISSIEPVANVSNFTHSVTLFNLTTTHKKETLTLNMKENYSSLIIAFYGFS
jgi:hypothetical protein